MNKKIIIYAAFVIFVLAVAFFYLETVPRPAPPAKNQLQVMASFYPLYFLADSIGGGKIKILNLTPSGAEPHDRELIPSDIINIEQSDILIMLGGSFEPWAESVVKNAKPDQKILQVGQNLITRTLTENGEKEEAQDPHIWLDPTKAIAISGKIADALIAADPVNANFYSVNTLTLQNQLSILNNKYKTELQKCALKEFITSHAAFGYLAAAYGLVQVPIAGLSPDVEPSPKTLSEISAFAKKNNIKHIFFENLVSPKLSETIAREIGAETLVLDPLEGLSAKDSGNGEDYFSKMESNLKNLKIALQCGN